MRSSQSWSILTSLSINIHELSREETHLQKKFAAGAHQAPLSPYVHQTHSPIFKARQRPPIEASTKHAGAIIRCCACLASSDLTIDGLEHGRNRQDSHVGTHSELLEFWTCSSYYSPFVSSPDWLIMRHWRFRSLECIAPHTISRQWPGTTSYSRKRFARPAFVVRQ